MKGLRTSLLVAGILLASLAESSGPVWILAAAGSFASFAALLAICVRQEAAGSAHEWDRRDAVEVTVFRPPPDLLSGQQGDADRAPRMIPPGWKPTGNPLPASGRRQSCRVP